MSATNVGDMSSLATYNCKTPLTILALETRACCVMETTHECLVIVELASEVRGNMEVVSRKCKRTSGAKVKPDKRKRFDESHGVPLVSKDAEVKKAGKVKAEKRAKRSRKEINQDLRKKTLKHFVKVNKKKEKVLERELKLEQTRQQRA